MSMTFSISSMKFRLSCLARTLAVATALGVAAPTLGVTSTAFASDSEAEAPKQLLVTIDRAKVVRIGTPADTIIVGNPSIVDATIQDARTIVLTGRNFGVTNMIILDSNGEAIVDETIVVQGHETNTVRIYRQAVRETLACSPVCESTLTIGDDTGKFATAETQIKARNSLAEEAAEKK